LTERLTSSQLQYAADLLKQGKLVAFPTETVYGLGASLFLPEAILAIFKAKGRPSDNPLIAHVSGIEQVSEIAREIPPLFYHLAEAFCPGPLTFVLKKHPRVPSIVSGGLDSIAIRIPAHSIAQILIELVGTPLVAPSANLSGKPSSTSAQHVLEDFEGKIAAVIDGGETEIGIESTVISLLGEMPVLLRPGVISQEEIERVVGFPILTQAHNNKGPTISPGMKYRHYAPKAPILLFYSAEALSAYLEANGHKQRRILAKETSWPKAFPLSAKTFYSQLRLADREGDEEILILIDETVQAESGLLNRILRAAALE